MNNVQQAITAIHSIQTNDELNQIIEAVKLKRQYLSKQAVRALGLETRSNSLTKVVSQ